MASSTTPAAAAAQTVEWLEVGYRILGPNRDVLAGGDCRIVTTLTTPPVTFTSSHDTAIRIGCSAEFAQITHNMAFGTATETIADEGGSDDADVRQLWPDGRATVYY